MARAKKTTKKSDMEVTMDRRSSKERRNKTDRRNDDTKVVTEKRISQRRAVTRRRQIDPTTCERDYTQDEIEFMHAMDAYKRKSGRMFPTCSEILEVVRDLGYQRPGSDQPTPAISGTYKEAAATTGDVVSNTCASTADPVGEPSSDQ